MIHQEATTYPHLLARIAYFTANTKLVPHQRRKQNEYSALLHLILYLSLASELTFRRLPLFMTFNDRICFSLLV
jgi:hypothetical protein